DELSLHHPDPAWATHIFQLVDQQRPYLQAWLPWVENTTKVEHTRNFLKEARMFNQYGQNLTTFVVLDQQIVGSVAFVRFDKANHSGEIGYWLNQDFQGQGIISRACQALVNYGFSHHALNRIEIKVARQNTKSRAIPLRLGFVLEGTLRQAIFRDQQYYDLDIFGRLAPGSPTSH
ncbi:MAG: GNAT family N-acetyltransferase, partial [Bacteroidota bacterium]